MLTTTRPVASIRLLTGSVAPVLAWSAVVLITATSCGGGSSPAAPSTTTTTTTTAATRVIALSGDLAFGSVEVGKSGTKTLTITNSGNATLTVTGVALPSAYKANWANGTIAASGTQTVAVTYTPTAAQSDGGTITVSGDQTSGAGTAAISGTGVSATGPSQTLTRIISVIGNLTFGDVSTGQTATSTLTIRNSGNSVLTVSGLDYPADFSCDFATGTIAAGEARSVAVTFTPREVRNYSGTLTIAGDQTSGTNTTPISGTGTSAGTPTPTPTRIIALAGTLTFGNVATGQTATSVLTITNLGNSTLTVSGVSYPPGFSGNFAGGTITAGASQSVTVAFAPSTAATYSGIISVAGDQTSGTNTIAVSGTGTGSAPAATRIIGLSGDLAFGSAYMGTTALRTLTISNSGSAALTWTGIDPGIPAVTASATSGTIAAGGTQYVTLTFAPTSAQTQAYSGTLTVTADQTSGTNTHGISATGLVSPRIISLSGDMAFGSVPYGSTATKTLTISNLGTSSLTVTDISVPCCGFFASNYSLSWTSGTIASGASKQVSITFTPANENDNNSGVYVVSGDQTTGTNTFSVSGRGSCSFTMTSPSSYQFSAAGGNGAVAVTTNGSCWWRIGERLPVGWPDAWLTAPVRTLTGSGSLDFSVSALGSTASRSYVMPLYVFNPGQPAAAGGLYGYITISQTATDGSSVPTFSLFLPHPRHF